MISKKVVTNILRENKCILCQLQLQKGSVFYIDQFRSYKSVIFYGKHEKIDHSKTLVEYNKHINGIEGFWSFAKKDS